MHLRQLGAFALGSLLMLAIGGGGAYAATGGSFVLGRSNSATVTTSLTNGQGTALSLTSRTGSPALKVSNQTKITNLNADKLDDLDSTKLALTAGRTGIVVGSSTDNDGFVNTAQCPNGSIATGGGGYASGTRDYLYYSGPDLGSSGAVIPNSWFAVSDGDTTAWVVCYNPRGTVAGAVANLPAMRTRGAAAASSTRKSTDPAQSTQKQFP